MATTISEVTASRPEEILVAADRAGESNALIREQISRARESQASLREAWQGSASDAEEASAARIFARQERIADTLQQLQSVLAKGGGELSATRSGIVDRVEHLTQVGFQVADNGSVSVRPGSRLSVLAELSPASAVTIQRAAAAASVDLMSLLAQFDAQDRELAGALNRATAGIDESADKPTDPSAPPPSEPKPDEPRKDEPKPPNGDNDAPVPGPSDKPGDPGYKVPHAPGDPADYPAKPGWKTDAKGEMNPPGYPPTPPGVQRDQNWRDYLNGKNGDGTKRPAGQPPPSYPLPEAVTDPKLKIIGAAENQQGTRYAWGGGSKDGTTQGQDGPGDANTRQDWKYKGFDCSGLSEYAIYQATGHDPGKGTSTQYAGMTQGAPPFGSVVQTAGKLDTSQLQPGDLIYYDGGQGVAGAHVAIYMGNGVTVETNNSGTPVHSQQATLSEGTVRVVRPN